MDRALLERMIGAIALLLLLVVLAPALLDGTRESSSGRLSNVQDDQAVRTEIIVLNEPRDMETAQKPKFAADPLQPSVIAKNRPAPAAKSEKSRESAVSAVIPAEVRSEAPAATPAPAPTKAVTPAKVPAAAAKVVATVPAASPSRELVTEELVVVTRPVTDAQVMPKALPEKAEATVAAADNAKTEGFAVQLGSFGQAENAQKYAAELSGRGFATFVRSGSTAAGVIHRVYAGPRPSRDAAAQLASALGSAGYRGIVVDLSAGNGTR